MGGCHLTQGRAWPALVGSAGLSAPQLGGAELGTVGRAIPVCAGAGVEPGEANVLKGWGIAARFGRCWGHHWSRRAWSQVTLDTSSARDVRPRRGLKMTVGHYGSQHKGEDSVTCRTSGVALCARKRSFLRRVTET